MENVAFITALERIIAASLREIPDLAMAVEGRTRARLAIFCFSRGHLREKGIALASACRLADLTAESTAHVAVSLHTHATTVTAAAARRGAVSLAAV